MTVDGELTMFAGNNDTKTYKIGFLIGCHGNYCDKKEEIVVEVVEEEEPEEEVIEDICSKRVN